MIVDNIDNLNTYVYMNKHMPKVLDFMHKNSLKDLASGEYEIDANNVCLKIQEYDTKMIDSTYPESHKMYIDLQIVLEGKEKIGYADLMDTIPFIPYDSVNDVEFWTGKMEYFDAAYGRFFIFFPQDVHHPSIAADNAPDKVRKAVFKLRII